jgi:hypothetical protein
MGGNVTVLCFDTGGDGVVWCRLWIWIEDVKEETTCSMVRAAL